MHALVASHETALLAFVHVLKAQEAALLALVSAFDSGPAVMSAVVAVPEDLDGGCNTLSVWYAVPSLNTLRSRDDTTLVPLRAGAGPRLPGPAADVAEMCLAEAAGHRQKSAFCERGALGYLRYVVASVLQLDHSVTNAAPPPAFSICHLLQLLH